MTHNENSDDGWLQTAAKCLKELFKTFKTSFILMCGQMLFITKPVMTNFFIFIEKYRKKTHCLNIKPVCRKRILGSDKKKNCDVEKSFIWLIYWTATIVWNVLCQWKDQGQQKDEMLSPRKLKRVYMLHASLLNSWEPNCSSCTWNESCLSDEEITVFFAKVIHGKIKAQETGTSFQLSAENLSAVVKMAIYIDFFN